MKTLLPIFDKPVLSLVDRLRANGADVTIAEDFPFVLSLSKHVKPFLRDLLYGTASLTVLLYFHP